MLFLMKKKLRIKIPDIIVVLIIVGFSSYMFFEARGFKRAALNLTMIGPLYYVILAFAVIRIIQSFESVSVDESDSLKTAKKGKLTLFWENNSRIIIIMLASIVYAVGLKFIGFYISTVIVLPVMMYLLGVKKIWLLAAVSVGVVLFFYLSFDLLLSVRLP